MYHKPCGEAAIFVDGAFVEPTDPLFLTPESYLYELDDDRAHPLDPVRVEVRDPDAGSYLGAITLRYAWMPPSFGSVDKERDAVGLNANARFSILKDYHGVILSRNGRLIDVQVRTPWTTFINNDRYIGVGVKFSAKLGELFGVTTSKRQVTISPAIWNPLRQAGLPKAIEQLRMKVREVKVAQRTRALAGGLQRNSERTMMVVAALPDGLRPGHQWDLGFRTAPYRVDFVHAAAEPFFRVGRKGGTRVLYLKTAHRFHEQIYDGPTATPDLRATLETMLFSLGDIALELAPDLRDQLVSQLDRWSRHLKDALAVFSTSLGNDDTDAEEAAWPTNES